MLVVGGYVGSHRASSHHHQWGLGLDFFFDTDGLAAMGWSHYSVLASDDQLHHRSLVVSVEHDMFDCKAITAHKNTNRRLLRGSSFRSNCYRSTHP